jgi:hypothetical protein
MSDLHGMLPPAEGRPRSDERGKVLHPFDREDERGEGWRGRRRFSTAIWPFVIGVILAVVAPTLSELLSDLNQWVLWLTFPFTLLVEWPAFGLRWELGGYLPQIVMFLQFPLEGLWVTLNLRLRGRLSFALAPLIFLHLAGAFVLFLLVQTQH